jgi:hypothetical protein
VSHDQGSIDRRLARLLAAPHFGCVVPHLPAETLHQLIRYRGLDACGEIVESATPLQLTSLLDIDLWHETRPGQGQQFDADRFGEWLEVLADTGPSVAARTIAALDRDLVVGGLSRYVRVLDPGIFEPTAQSDDEPIDRYEAMREGDSLDGEVAMDAGPRRVDAGPPRRSDGRRPECEVGGYIVRARRGDAWDAIVTLLLSLDADYPRDFHAVMQGCRRLSNSQSEVDGLDNLLIAPAQHLHDVAIERDRRRSRFGYATPADARAFLEMARQAPEARSAAAITGSLAVNPIVAAYLRETEDAPPSSSKSARAPTRLLNLPASTAPSATDVAAGATDVPDEMGAIIALLAEAGMMSGRPRALLASTAAEPQAAALTLLQRLTEYVRDVNDAACVARGRELAFLANALLAGCSVQSRPFTPREASDAAASICNLGLEHWPTCWPGGISHGASTRADHMAAGASPTGSPPDAFLIDHDLVTAFEVGWRVLHQDVSLFVAQQLVAILDAVHTPDSDVQRGLVTLRRALVEQCEAGTPWRARGAADVLATLDMMAWTSVLGLLDECPVMPDALTAVLSGRVSAVSPVAFDFIATAAQIDGIRTFMRKLPDLLSG